MSKLTSFRRRCLALAIAHTIVLSQAQAANIVVNSNADDGSGGCTLREAIISANDNTATGGCASGGAGPDSISFSGFGPGSTISLTSGTALTVSETLVINGTGRDDLVIAGTGEHRVFHVDSASLMLMSLTVTGGSLPYSLGVPALYGAGIYGSPASSIELVDSTVSGNFVATPGNGGGILVRGDEGNSTLTLSGSTVSGNTANFGGGITLYEASLHVSNSTISDNHGGQQGGGIYALFSSLTLDNCEFSGNSANVVGGGLLVNGSTLSTDSCTFTGNYADVGGGLAVHYQAGTANIENSVIAGNTARVRGGGLSISMADTGPVTLTGSRVTGNRLTGTGLGENVALEGGGIYARGVSLQISNSSISGNTARLGGGLFLYENAAVLIHQGSTIANNLAELSPGNAHGLGGGISQVVSGLVTLEDCTVSGNRAQRHGGGMRVRNASFRINRCTISGNSATENGGGLYSSIETVGYFNLGMINSTISGNSAGMRGGGLLVRGGWDDAYVHHLTITGNSAATGGGVYLDQVFVRFHNSIISGNEAATGTDFANDASLSGWTAAYGINILGDSSRTTAQALYNFNPQSGYYVTATSDGLAPTALSGIIGALEFNGGPNRTHGPVFGSPALDGADQSICDDVSNPIPTDQRGEPRDDDACDIGAVEGAVDNSFCIPVVTQAGQTVAFCL